MTDESEQQEQDPAVTAAVEQADQFHLMMDNAKAWSRKMAAEMRVKAALEDDEETAAELEQIAGLVESVTNRIEQGDNTLARKP
jgi:hypothetical protein